MYGEIIGDIAGSENQANSGGKNKLFSEECHYSEHTVMTFAVARAILRSREERYDKRDSGRSFCEILNEQMNSAETKGGFFAGSNGRKLSKNGREIAAIVSPCAIAAISMREAQALAAASASAARVSSEEIKEAEAVASAILMAKFCRTKEEIKKYISSHYFPLDDHLKDFRSE